MSGFYVQILSIILMNRRCMVIMMKWRHLVGTIAIWFHDDYSSSWLRLSWFECSNHLCLWWWWQILQFLLKPWFECKLIRNSSSYLNLWCITRHHRHTWLTLLHVGRLSFTTLISRSCSLCKHIRSNLFTFQCLVTILPIDRSKISVPE